MIEVIVTLSAPTREVDVLDVTAGVALALAADNPLPDGVKVHSVHVEEQDD